MLPKSHQKLYQKFFTSLTKLRAQVMMKDVDLKRLSNNFQIVQGTFQDQILESMTGNLENSATYSLQSIQTEIHRTLRLLRTDLLFLQSSYRQRTEEQRLKIVLDHIEKLIGYCQIILD